MTESLIADSVDQVKEALLEADVPYVVVENLIDELRKKIVGQQRIKSLKPAEQFIDQVYKVMCQFMGEGTSEREYAFKIPSTVMVMGLQGSGKTTTIAKLAHHIVKEAQKKGKTRTVLLSSIDFYRPAAIEQLKILATQAEIPFYRAQSTDAIEAAKEIASYAKQKGVQHLFLDTAGRLHVDIAMMRELTEINKIIKPQHKLLILDAMTGQESLAIAKKFDQEVGFEAAILTKTDSDTRGGAAFSFRYMLKKPILFVGMGEKITDLSPFNAKRVVGKIVGQGDLLTLAEKADEKIKQTDQARVMRAFTSGELTLDDFAHQISMMSSLGSLSSLVSYLPGMSTAQFSRDQIEESEREIKRFKAIINSMTLKERLRPELLDQSRKNRIAKGAGVSGKEVDCMLDRFQKAQQYVKLFRKSGFLKSMFR